MRLAFVLTKTPVQLDPQSVVRAYQSLFPAGAKLSAEPSDDPNTATLHIDGDDLMLGVMPTAIPKGEAEAAARFSLGSFGNVPPVTAHGGHIIVVQRDQRTKPDSMTRFTRALAAVMTATDAVGVYWGDAGVTHSTRFFVDVARSEAMTMLWTGVSLANPEGKLSMLSLGMKQFDLPDLLLTGPRRHGNAALEIFFDLLSYVIGRGAVPADNETIGRSTAEKWTVRHQPSPIDPKRTVWSVELPDEMNAR